MAWNGIGSKSSGRISFYVGAPQKSIISTNKSTYSVGETVYFTFDTEATPNCNVIWIYKPDGTSEYATDLGHSYSKSFYQVGTYEAEVVAWNGVGSKTSKRIKFTVYDPNVHTYSSTWSTNSTQHWHQCTHCDAKKDTADHIYTSDFDSTCNVCNYVRTLRYNDSITYTFDDATGTLTLSGNGVLDQENFFDSIKTSIKRVIIGNGITKVGDNIFKDYTKQNAEQNSPANIVKMIVEFVKSIIAVFKNAMSGFVFLK